MSFSRTLRFKADQTIDTPVTFMFAFDKPAGVSGLNQVAWRVYKFERPNNTASLTYQQNLMFSAVQIDARNKVTTKAHVEMRLGEKTDLVDNGSNVEFRNPTTGNAGQLTATNLTRTVQNMAIGFLDTPQSPNPLLVWPSVQTNNTVAASFAPVLSAYVMTAYEEGQLITGEIPSPVLFKRDLTTHPNFQAYIIRRNQDGSYNIIPENSV